MKGYQYLDNRGTFQLENPELTSYLYFPIANESGVMSSVTPTLGGDSKMGQNTFLLAPVSSEDLHNNKSSRNFWCNITGKGIWSATGRSALQEAKLFTDEKEKTILEAGVMWQKVTRISKEFGLTSEITSFVPSSNDTVEIMMVTLKNSGNESIQFTPTAAIPMYGRSADNVRDHRHVTSLLHRIETTKYGVALNPTLTFDERGHRKNEVVYGVFGATDEGTAPVGFYPCVEDFIGDGGSFENPRAISDSGVKLVLAGNQLNGYEALGGIQFEAITLAPGQEKTYLIVMGYGATISGIEAGTKKFLSKQVCIDSFNETKAYWEEKINVSYNTGSKDFDSWMHWVNFQPMLRRIYGCSFLPHHDYGRGGRGWRDLWQDCLALLIMNPSGVKDMLISNFGGVRIDGTNATIIGTNQGEFIADRNNITRVWMDHGVWPFITTNLYIMQSGDISILLKENNYFKDPQAVRGEEKDLTWKPEDGNLLRTATGEVYTGTILEHILIEHLSAFYDVGEHNHMRLRGADWNDALDMAKERGESVAFTAIYGGNLEQLAKLILSLDHMGINTIKVFKEIAILLEDNTDLYDSINGKQELLKKYCYECRHTISGEQIEVSCKELAENLLKKSNWIKEHIRQTEWITNLEGKSWYNGYYDNHGRRVDGDFETGTRMMLTGQVFTIMSGTATDEQVQNIVTSADTYLYDGAIGGYKLNTNFNEIKDDLGRMFGFAYGHKENGAVFSHMAVMYANALYQRGFVSEGYKAIKSLYTHCSNFEKSKIYPGVPEYIGDNGRGLYHYLTGSASWLLLTVLTEMFGIKGDMGNLRFDPKLMKEQFDDNNKAEVNLVFADRKLNIQYSNIHNKEFGEYQVGSITINGTKYDYKNGYEAIQRNDIVSLDSEKEHNIMVELI
ncbi:MAG: cellobiose phosphorylase-like protein [Anaerocolumna sp.]|nr:cellobiose phosphorylase-like protein [Anaerocolumna sp.]